MTAASRSESGKPHPTQPYAWCLKAVLDQTAGATPTIYITSHIDPVEWNGKTWEPYPFTVAPFSVDTKGRRDTIEITLDNSSLEAGRWTAHGKGFRDMPFELYGIQLAFATSGNSDYEVVFKGYVDEPTVSETAVRLPVRQSKASSRQWPWMLYVPGCHATYQDPLTCGYDGALPSCAKTLSDCIVHGEDEFTNDRAVIHPQRFHGFPGVPRAR